ncbi:MAG TPA: VOC family protein [Longimicrobiales bacterium]|nr:VOC family protein [Longimicrobiales bacterium]
MKTATLQARGLAPSLTVDDLQRSIQFYTDGLGFTVDEEFKEEGKLQGVMLEAGDARFGLTQDDFAKGRNRTKGVGLRFYLETDQDIVELARQAQRAGIVLDDGPGPLPWGPAGFTITDPDGFKMTISNPM